MIQGINFEVGQTYKNRKGKYTVVAIDGNVMQISWKNGKEVATTVKLQSRVLENIQREIDDLALLKVKVASPRKKAAAAV
jgi:ribosomal protein L25 (general stress protein Ctc)